MAHAPLEVDREQMKMLVQSVGCSEAAKQTGVKLNTVLSWSAREGWLKELKEAKPVLPAHLQPRAIDAIKPVDALSNTLRERQEKTKLHQSKYVMRASEKLADIPDETLLDHAPVGKLLSDMASKVWPEQQGPANTAVAVNILIGNPPE
jgi:hypothetical protein